MLGRMTETEAKWAGRVAEWRQSRKVGGGVRGGPWLRALDAAILGSTCATRSIGSPGWRSSRWGTTPGAARCSSDRTQLSAIDYIVESVMQVWLKFGPPLDEVGIGASAHRQWRHGSATTSFRAITTAAVQSCATRSCQRQLSVGTRGTVRSKSDRCARPGTTKRMYAASPRRRDRSPPGDRR